MDVKRNSLSGILKVGKPQQPGDFRGCIFLVFSKRFSFNRSLKDEQIIIFSKRTSHSVNMVRHISIETALDFQCLQWASKTVEKTFKNQF